MGGNKMRPKRNASLGRGRRQTIATVVCSMLVFAMGLGQAVIPVLPGDTADTLAARLLPAEHRLYPAVLRRFAIGERAPLALFP